MFQKESVEAFMFYWKIPCKSAVHHLRLEFFNMAFDIIYYGIFAIVLLLMTIAT